MRNHDHQRDKDIGRQVPLWKELFYMLLFFVGLMVTCCAVSVIFWSVYGPYKGHWTAFHITALILILLHGGTSGMIVLQFPYLSLSYDEISTKTKRVSK